MVIKSRSKLIWFIIIINLFIFSILVCFGIYYLFDTVWNGSFVDWFTLNYTENKVDYRNGKEVLIHTVAWYKLKPILFQMVLVAVILIIIIIVITAYVYGRKKKESTIKNTSNMIYTYMTEKKDAMEVFPTEYAEIAAQIVQMKSDMQHHEQILKEENRRKNDLITYLAHDLKTPLTSVIGYLNLLDEASDMPIEQKKKYIKITLNKADRLEQLINEFFDITRYNLQTVVLEKETIDLYYMLIQMTDEFYPILQAHGNQVNLQADENLTVYGDSIKLARVFNNILKNAISYSYKDTMIDIIAEHKNNEVILTFRNHGKTIPEQKLNDIFEKFFRLDESRAANTGGAGLGLAIAKEIITLHGGTIIAKSKEEITTFSVTLPMKKDS